MKINAIDKITTFNFGKVQDKTPKENNSQQNATYPLEDRKLTGKAMGVVLAAAYPHQAQYQRLVKGMLSEGQQMAKLAEKYARQYVVYKDDKSKIALITKDHYYLAYLDTIMQYAKRVQNDEVDYNQEPTSASGIVAERTTAWIWMRNFIDKTAKIIDEEQKRVQKQLEEKSTKNGFVSGIMVEKSFMKDIDDMHTLGYADSEPDAITAVASSEACFIIALLGSTNPNNKAYISKINEFFHKLSMAASTDEIDDKKHPSMSYYNDVADRAIKNADRNYNMYVAYSPNDESAPDYFISTLKYRLQNLDDSQFKNFKKGQNTELIVFNDKANLRTIADECKQLKKNTDTQYFIVVKDLYKTIMASVAQNNSGQYIIPDGIAADSIGQDAKNIHFIAMSSTDVNNNPVIQEGVIGKAIREYQNMQIPIMDTTNLGSQVLETKDYIKSKFSTNIEDDALLYIASLPLNTKGSAYDNVIRFINNIVSYYIDSEVITKDMVQSYWETTQRDDMATQDNPYDIVFDTKKNLGNIIGTPMVKKQAQKVIYELTNFPSTKGYILQNAGTISGRLNCAKAIAGELEIPMICINAADFAIRDIDTVTNDPMNAIEEKMNKLLNTMRTQAQANKRKMVMLYISNFDHFASNPLYGLSSIYEQQAFQKLLKEMNKTYNDKSYNIVVMGASNHPEITNEDIMRPGLFMDSITIYPPETADNVKEIAQHYISQRGYKLDDEQTLIHFTKIMKSNAAEYIDAAFILDKANVSAHKRNSETISVADINEAYLSTIAGEVPEIMYKDIHKEAVVRHEGGHALNLQFMYNLFKEREDSMRIGNSIVNVVLDPRGWYGGCVYPMRSWENMGEMNMETVMADIICDFGGNSAEEYFYNMEGSWGISQDRKIANEAAREAVLYMGLGARMKHYIPDIDPETGTPILCSSDEEDYVKDVRTILENAKIASDKIVRCYEDFLVEFSDKYVSKYGTGDCIVTGDDFAKMLKDWEGKQSPKKKREIEKLKKEILALIKATKEGKVYQGINAINPMYRMF